MGHLRLSSNLSSQFCLLVASMGCPGSKNFKISAPEPCTGHTLLELQDHDQAPQNPEPKTSSRLAEPNVAARDANERLRYRNRMNANNANTSALLLSYSLTWV